MIGAGTGAGQGAQGDHRDGLPRRGFRGFGMAFVDALIAESDADVVMVDRRDAPGGHWNDAYPFVRLHQPSTVYGVNSRVLGNDSIDETGPNAGFYERATGQEICDYYEEVLDNTLLASGQVRFFGGCDYVADRSNGHRIVSRDTGEGRPCGCGGSSSTPPTSSRRCRRRTRRTSRSPWPDAAAPVAAEAPRFSSWLSSSSRGVAAPPGTAPPDAVALAVAFPHVPAVDDPHPHALVERGGPGRVVGIDVQEDVLDTTPGERGE